MQCEFEATSHDRFNSVLRMNKDPNFPDRLSSHEKDHFGYRLVVHFLFREQIKLEVYGWNIPEQIRGNQSILSCIGFQIYGD